MIKTLIYNTDGYDYFVKDKKGELVGPINNSKAITDLFNQLIIEFKKHYPDSMYQHVDSITFDKTQLIYHVLTFDQMYEDILMDITKKIEVCFEEFDKIVSSTKGFIWAKNNGRHERVHSMNYMNETYSVGMAQFSEKDYYNVLHYLPSPEKFIYEEKQNCFTEESKLFTQSL